MSQETFLPNTVPTSASSLLSNRPVLDGEPVTAAVTNRLPTTNQGNTAYLHELLKRAKNNCGEFLWGVPVAEDVICGDFVYYDSGSRVFAKGLARYVSNAGTVWEADTSQIWGVVISVRDKDADLCTSGLCEFTTSIQVYFQRPEPGVRFLSDQVAGELTVARPTLQKCLGYQVGVKGTDRVQFFVRHSLDSDARLHRHRSVELKNVPAGSWERNRPNMIRSVQPDKPGWLPATDPIFTGKALPDAKFGYNPVFWLQEQLTGQAVLRWQRKQSESDDPLLALVPPEFYRIDGTTVWWLTDSPAYLPWDKQFEYSDGEIVNDHNQPYRQRLWLDDIGTGYGLTDSHVTTLRAKSGSGLTVTRYPIGQSALTGDLLLDLTVPFREITETDPGPFAVKKIDGYDLSLGPVVAGLKLDSSRLRILHSDRNVDGVHSGLLILGDPTGKTGQELLLEAVHLQGVEEAVERESIGLAFPASRHSSLLARVTVPYDESFDRFLLTFFFGILVTRSGNIASDILKLSYRIIESPHENNMITQAFPQNSLQQLACDFQVRNTQYSTGYYTAESSPFPVTPGDLVCLKIERTPPDNFSDRIILLRKTAMIGL